MTEQAHHLNQSVGERHPGETFLGFEALLEQLTSLFVDGSVGDIAFSSREVMSSARVSGAVVQPSVRTSRVLRPFCARGAAPRRAAPCRPS